jgi:alpha-amylase
MTKLLSIFCFASLFCAFSCQNSATPLPQSPESKPAMIAKLKPKEIPDWAINTVLYEVNVRQFSTEGTLKAVQNQLARLHNLGVGTIWLMPIFPIGEKNRKGSLGSPYSVRDYKIVNPDLGTKDDLIALVQEAHHLGMKVILDWVPNHTSWDHVWIKEHPEYYTKVNGQFSVPLNEKGEQIPDWSDVCDLDYSQAATRAAMIDAMQYWVGACDIDGFRVDMAGLVPLDFWQEAIPQLQQKKHLYLLAEWQDEKGHLDAGFHANYGWRFKDVTKEIATGKSDANALDSLLVELDTFYNSKYQQLYFTLNHDENTWSGTESELYGPAADAMNVLAFTWQGMPMIYNGQEEGLSQRLAFFEKNPIKWGVRDRSRLFRELCQLKTNCKAAHYDSNRPTRIVSKNNKQIYAFVREKEGSRLLVILNLSKRKVDSSLMTENIIGNWNDKFTGSLVSVSGPSHRISLPAWGYQVLEFSK